MATNLSREGHSGSALDRDKNATSAGGEGPLRGAAIPAASLLKLELFGSLGFWGESGSSKDG